MVHFTNLERLAENMRGNHIPASSFTVNYNNTHNFTCLFIDDINEPSLYISSLGQNPFTIILKGDQNFNFSVFLGDNYYSLCNYLGIHQDPNHPFTPTGFFEQFDTYIPVIHTNSPHPRDIATLVNLEERNVAEAEKIFFCGWFPHGNTVSDLNFKKTYGLVGYEEAARLREAHVSSRWTDIENDERLALIADSINY